MITAPAKHAKTGEYMGRISVRDKRWRLGRIVGVRKGISDPARVGKVPVLDAITGLSAGFVEKDDERYLREELVHISVNTTKLEEAELTDADWMVMPSLEGDEDDFVW